MKYAFILVISILTISCASSPGNVENTNNFRLYNLDSSQLIPIIIESAVQLNFSIQRVETNNIYIKTPGSMNTWEGQLISVAIIPSENGTMVTFSSEIYRSSRLSGNQVYDFGEGHRLISILVRSIDDKVSVIDRR